MNIQVRPANREDAQTLWMLQRAAFLPLYERYHDSGNPGLRGVEDVARRLEHPGYRCFCVMEDGETVGGVVYRCWGKGFFFDELREGEYYLQRVFIRPDRQSAGVGSRAILLCERALANARKVFVDFPEDLEKNRKCYEKAGFRDTGRREEVETGLILAGFEKTIRE